DTNFDRSEHLSKYRRSYTGSLFLPEEPHTPAIVNLEGPATQYSPGQAAEIIRRAEKTDSKHYFQELAQSLTHTCANDSERVQRIG
ncbi:MAG: hypothetical protein QF886_20210, partial [Planctomycetota bacterium]|nr:hypothetical protein [Planctomycetota bacterium]